MRGEGRHLNVVAEERAAQFGADAARRQAVFAGMESSGSVFVWPLVPTNSEDSWGELSGKYRL